MRTHVLLVESEPDDGMLLRVLLERAGHRVTEGLVTGNLPTVDVVLVDAGSARDDGAARCRELRRAVGERGLVVVSEGVDGRLVEAGADACVGRPLRARSIVGAVERALAAALGRREAERQAAALALSRAEAERDWLRYLVHDLNNPLTVIAGGLRLVAGEPLTERQADAVQHASMATARLTRLVRAMLDLGRAQEGGGLRPELGPVAPAGLLERCAALVATTAGLKGVRVEQSSEASASLVADVDMLERALVNLAENAVRHAPRGSVVRLYARDRAGAIELGVRDEGPGVPPELRDRLFEPFNQGDDSRVRGVAGLGLAFCRLVAEAHGGRASLHCPPAGGADFRLTLPIGPR